MIKFISIVLLTLSWQTLFSQGIGKEMEQTAWNSIRTKFLGNAKRPIIYSGDISIKLTGEVTSVDSICMNELIDSLKIIIPDRKISLTIKNSNLVFDFSNNPSQKKGFSAITISNDIQFTEISMSFALDVSQEVRKKVLYFYLFRSLVHFSQSETGRTEIKGCVFNEKNPEDITYSRFDSFILSKLYAKDFKEQFRNNFVRQNSYRNYLITMYHRELETIFLLLGMIITAILLSIAIVKGLFKSHHWNWLEFNKQGVFLVLTGCIYVFCISLSDLHFNRWDLETVLNLFYKSLIAVNLIFFVEKSILKSRKLGGSKIIINFTTTLIILIIVAYPFHQSPIIIGSYPFYQSPLTFNNIKIEQDIFSLIQLRYNLLFPYILIIALARIFFIFLNDKYSSIIYKKDVELAQINELHKQAELQSLQAKINPHFLYNALNSIAGLATTDALKTEQMALSLSDFFKYAINREQKQFNPLSEELNAILTYLEIEKVRFGDRLNFEVDCPAELQNVQIPQLLIQPLVENAIKHGLSKITGNGMIKISVSKEEHQLRIRIFDNGPAFSDGPLTGYGIQNTQERINLIYGAKASVNWYNGSEKHIELNLPLEKA